MRIEKLHDWNLTPQEAVILQKELVDRLVFRPLKGDVRTVAGVDISYSKGDPRLFAAVIVFDLIDRKIKEVASTTQEATFPYRSGLLAFREIPSLLKAFKKLSTVPDVVLCDGQGIAHPRRMGLAAHLGLWLGIPTIGCAKTRLVGEFADLCEAQWAQVPLIHRGEEVGVVLRTKPKVRPLFISPGHLIDIESSIGIIKKSVTRYRLPDPIRQAHLKVNELRLGRGVN